MKRLLLASAILLASPATSQGVQPYVSPDVWQALQFCPPDASDGLYHFKTTPCPPPLGYLPSPSLNGLPDTPNPNFVFSAAAHLTGGTGLIPPSAAPDVVGAFRFICAGGQVLADDPIVYPGQPGKSHLHQFYGNDKTDANTTFVSAGLTGGSTCNRGVAVPANHSSYWMPAMLDAQGNSVKVVFTSIYYKRRPASDPKCSLTSGDPDAEGNCVGIPNGIKFIFGYDMLTGKAPTGGLWFDCQNYQGKSIPGVVPGHYPDLPSVLKNCPVGALVGAVIEAPQCWDGKWLDTPNHRDHVAYRIFNRNSRLVCPSTHPYVMPGFKLGAWFPSMGPGMSLSSDAMHPELPKGSTFHADYFERWEPSVKAMWMANCINKMLNCSSGVLGNGYTLNGAS
jgi:hypothetical protein